MLLCAVFAAREATQRRAVVHRGLSSAGIRTVAQRWSPCLGCLGCFSSLSPVRRPPGCSSLLSSRAQSLVDGSKSGCWRIRDCVVLSKGRIPRTKQYSGAIGIVFFGFFEAFCPLPQTVKAVLEALKRYFNVILDHFLGLEMRARGPGEHRLWHILLNPNQQQSAELKRRQKNRLTSVPRAT